MGRCIRIKEEKAMLVLTRKLGQRVYIGENVSIVVNRVCGNRVSLGIEAPGSLRVVRGELKVNNSQRDSTDSTNQLEPQAADPVANR